MAGGKPPFRDQSLVGVLRSLARSLGRRPRSAVGPLSGATSGEQGTSAQTSVWTPPMIMATVALLIVIVVSVVVLQRVYSTSTASPNPLGSGSIVPTSIPTAIPVKLVVSPGTPITPTTVLGGADAESTLLAPQEAVQASDGLIYVADTGNHRVAVLNKNGKLVRTITKSARGALLSSPSSLVLTPDGHLVVLDSDTGIVLEYTTNGALVNSSSRAVPLIHARGIAVDAQGQIYVADPATNSIFTLDTGLNIVHQETASPDGGKTFLFQQPTAVAPAPGGGMYVVDGQIGALDLFSADWQLQHTWPLAITDTLHSPRVLPLADGRVLATDPADNKLLLFTPGVVQPAFYALNTVPGPLAAPLGIASASKHRVLLTCTGANQLWLAAIPGVV